MSTVDTPQEVNGRAEQETTQEGTEEMTTATEENTAPQDSAIQLSKTGSALGKRPVSQSEFDVAGTMVFSGIRPIEADHMEVYGTLIGGRPIEASHLDVVDTDSLPGHRPVFSSDLAVIEADTLPEHRPIAASPAFLMESSTLPGGRPIASNNIDDPKALMGYLD